MPKHVVFLHYDFREGWPSTARELRTLLRRYGISRATAYRLRALALANPKSDFSRLAARRRGRPTMAPATRKRLLMALRKASDALKAKWLSALVGKKGRPKKAAPLATFGEFRAAAREAGVTCSDSRIRKTLREMEVRTAGQSAFRKRRRTSNASQRHLPRSDL